ncbi:hypothetical protein BaRGS_00024247 [Batillaria attramentaria]|uniref:Uncharacterized protein n=1 Tax=Batillaria attramentaria TaxID=370345 RepID=A0ABD0KBZ8_9CAEN
MNKKTASRSTAHCHVLPTKRLPYNDEIMVNRMAWNVQKKFGFLIDLACVGKKAVPPYLFRGDSCAYGVVSVSVQRQRFMGVL